MGEVGPKIDSDTSQSTDSISFSQARAVFANSASMKEDETARSSKSNSPSPSTSRTKTNALDAGWTTQLDQHSGVNSAHEHASNGLAVAYHPGVHLNKCASGAYTIRSSELSTTHYDALSVGVEVHAINGEILRGLNEKEVANLLSGREGSLVSMVICTASMGFETTSLTLVRSFEMRGQSLVQCEGTSGNHYNKSGVHHSIAFSLSGDLDASPSLTEPVGANALRIKEETPAVADENVNIEQTSGVCREDKDATIVQSLSNDGDADDLQKPLSQLNLQDDLFHNGEEFIPNSVPLDPKPEDAKPNQDVVAQYFNPDIDVPQQFHSDNSVSQYFNPDSNVSQYLNSDNLVSQYLNSESSAPQRFNSDHDAVQSESVERRKNEVTLEQLIAIGVTDPEEQARILGTSVHSPQPASQPQVSLPLRSERADEDMEIRRAREVAQLIAIGVKDPVEQSQILGYDASLYWNPKPKPVESNPVKQQCSAPSSSPAAPEAARPPEDPAKQMKGQKQQEKPRI
ncbi:hypothetical protein GUITHDRAFT_136030 [Guillardia theta CCMP2712]|uniref:PDZ domain-containing protein n=1 Tax=Guillardia theta (strain CCMP2712) TaxID=905079 RepID=L1JME3_GUITC|nr:hypothetical protein GUITHDRAFT_136030 [Guillardia theta CCMP2712]EKX49345.1 hypothetical protein GUITHDRAFT_136030 [Guillardia theta CCMP2712]|eukprot:XP_005836325.1 hypothetical protein GUITHDRAFT_136030 [Guillardia theta CCMP2712]